MQAPRNKKNGPSRGEIFLFEDFGVDSDDGSKEAAAFGRDPKTEKIKDLSDQNQFQFD